MTVEEVQHDPRAVIEAEPELREALVAIADGRFSHGDRTMFQPLLDSLWNHDPYLVAADFPDYVRCQEEVDRAYLDPERWTTMSILNAARMGKFSSDRSMREYCREIWRVEPLPTVEHDDTEILV
jgi:starch phosphorylase